MIKPFIRKFLLTFIFWLLFFAVHRLVFMVANVQYADGTPLGELLWSFLVGIRLDSSFTGYIMVIAGITLLPVVLFKRQLKLCWFNGINKVLIVLLSGFLLGDLVLYSFWGKHMDSEAIGFLKTPDIVMASLHWYQLLLFVAALSVLSFLLIKLFRVITKVKLDNKEPHRWKYTFATAGIILLVTGTMIGPIRGSVGVAPINTGVAYFSTHRYANHCAINPLWNLSYDMKKMDKTKVQFKFMEDEKASAIHSKLMHESGQFSRLLKTERPNIVIILLESFGGHIIESLGGYPVTPNLHKLESEGIFFNNIYAAANRSDKGLVATIAGYPVLPSYSIIRFPEKTNSLPFLPKKLKENGYNDLMYMYGGDIKFKNMNSFVKQAGFKKVVSIDDFDSDLQGEKWGVHDEYTFRRLVSEMKASQEPYFKFFFTLSSHEPFDVPMERIHENNYHNSIAYTDKCIGEFINEVKKQNLWDNTLFVFIADHGVGGPDKLTIDKKEFHHIPMLWTGGALTVQDSVVSKIGSQTDLAKTLLCQLGIESGDMAFSKNILDEESHSFAYFIIPGDGMGLVQDGKYQAYRKMLKKFIHMEGQHSSNDSLLAKAYLQMIYNDHQSR